MTVSELVERLKAMDPGATVIVEDLGFAYHLDVTAVEEAPHSDLSQYLILSNFRTVKKPTAGKYVVLKVGYV